jgi:phage tail sheath protein FI
MADYKTPGVFIEEISKLPASVAPVATAIPAFVGYTSKMERDGETLDPNTPVRITSLMEFETIFGGPFPEVFDVTIGEPPPDETDPTIDVEAAAPGLSPYLLYYQLRMYFANNGGPCYIVSVGTYNETDPIPSNISESDLTSGLDACEEVDEITLLTVPEAILLDANGRESINNAMLGQCNKLQDRFAILEAFTDPAETPIADGNNFREDVSMDNLKYGAAYYPSLKSTISYFYEDSDVTITDNRGGTGSGFFHNDTLDTLIDGSKTGVAATGSITIDNNNIEDDIFVINGIEFKLVSSASEPNEVEIGSSTVGTAANLQSAINDANIGINADKASGSDQIDLEAASEGNSGNTITLEYINSGTSDSATLSGSTLTGGQSNINHTLYSLIKAELDNQVVTLYPSGAMAGVYARVDRERGVWKAPANVSLNLVEEPSKLLTDDEQAPLNVDADTGKSINVIRNFYQKGTIVWGARTLAGNDNEWRYVPVRRLFIFIEESIQKATEPVIFEPNDANTWSKTKSMIENFLTGLWRDGALAGATPEEAFFVKVGLGETMSSVDILKGRMIIEVGIAAVRPAEFIILKFSHKLQEA